MLLLILACSSPETPGDVVFTGGNIHTMDATNSNAQALAIRDGVLVYVGDDASAFIGPDTRVQALGGATVLPAFHDAHTHLVWSGADLLMVDVYSAQTTDEIQAEVVAWAEANPEEAWVHGGGWDTSTFYGSIDKSLLDEVVTDRPAYIYSSDSHIGLASALALEAAGITAATPDPSDGTIERDADGNPTGILLEGAMTLVDSLIPTYADATVDRGLKDAQQEANRYGVISVVDANVTDWMLEGYARADAKGMLTVRVFGAVEVGPDDTDAADQISAMQVEYGSPRVSVNAAKLYLDGIIESGTAAMIEPYEDGTNGDYMFTDDELLAVATSLDAAGHQLHAHAIGDGAVRQFLDTVAAVDVANGNRDRRPLAAHIEVVDPDDIGRFAELGVLADFQAVWAWPDSYIQQLTWPVIGDERSEWLYPIGQIVAAGGTYVGGSDWSVTSQNPFEAIEAAVTRQNPYLDDGPVLTPDALVDIVTAVRAYTSAGASASFTDDISGTIEVGKQADLVVLELDPLTLDPADLSQLRVDQTWLDGERVFALDPSTPDDAARRSRPHSHGH
jgi:predicted amidohydrolase YtcJ